MLLLDSNGSFPIRPGSQAIRIAFFALLLWLILALAACGHREARPDLSPIPITAVHIDRFDTAFFALDSNNIEAGLYRLSQTYPWFMSDFIGNILGLGPLSDTSHTSFAATRQFLTTYRPLRDSIASKYQQLDWLEKALSNDFRYIKYYFPKYRLPEKAVSYIGPFDGPGVAITAYALAIGLQSYAGKNFSFYLTQKGQDLYPTYISRRFEPEYIEVNCINVLAQDIFPDSSENKPLIDQMIIKGKYWWLAGKLLPETPDSIRTGYTQAQLNWCATNEVSIWNFFLQGDLFTVDPDLVKNYIGEGPKTLGMPDPSPGNIGAWVGWQIVKKYVADHSDIQPEQLMRIPARTIFETSRYKPK